MLNLTPMTKDAPGADRSTFSALEPALTCQDKPSLVHGAIQSRALCPFRHLFGLAPSRCLQLVPAVFARERRHEQPLARSSRGPSMSNGQAPSCLPTTPLQGLDLTLTEESAWAWAKVPADSSVAPARCSSSQGSWLRPTASRSGATGAEGRWCPRRRCRFAWDGSTVVHSLGNSTAKERYGIMNA